MSVTEINIDLPKGYATKTTAATTTTKKACLFSQEVIESNANNNKITFDGNVSSQA